MSTLMNENTESQNETNEVTSPVITKEQENVVNNEQQIQTKEINDDTKEEHEQVEQKVDEKETTNEEHDVKEKDTNEESKSKINEITEQPKECDDVIKENKVNTIIEEEVKENKCSTEIDNSEIQDNNQQSDNATNNEQIIKTENISEVINEQTGSDKIDTTNHNEQQKEIIDDSHNQHEQNQQNDNEQQQQQHIQQDNNTIINETSSKQEPPQQQEQQQEQQPSTNPHLDSLTETYKTLHNTFPSTTYPLLSPLLSLITSQLTTYSTLTSLPISSPEYNSLLSSNLTSLSSSLSTLLPLNQHSSLSLSSPISFTIPLSNPKPQIKKRQVFSKSTSSNYQTNPSTTKYSKHSTKTTKLNRSSDSLTSPTKQEPSKQSAPSSVQPKQHTRIHNNSTITSSPPSNKNNNNTLSSLHNIKSQNTSTTKHIRSANMKMPNTDKVDTYTQGNSNTNNKEQSVFLSAIHVNRPTKHIKKGVPEHCKKHQKVFNKSNSAKRIGYSTSSSARTSVVPKSKETATPVAGKTVLPDKNILDYASFHEKTEKEFENIGAKPSSYAKYLVKKYKDVVQNYQQVDEDEQKTSGKKINKKETNSNHSINGSNIDLYDYLKRNKQKFKHYKYNFLYEGEDGKKVSATTENTNLNTLDTKPKAMSKIQVLKKK